MTELAGHYIVTMVCGHDSKWVYTDGDLRGPGTSYCLMCLVEEQAAEIKRLKSGLGRIRKVLYTVLNWIEGGSEPEQMV